jgi:hypothetical protein
MNNLVLLVVGIAITVISSVASFLERRKENRSGRKSDAYNRLTFVAILAGAIVSFSSGYSSLLQKAKSDRQREVSDSLSMASQRELQAKSDMIIHIQQEQKRQTDSLNASLSRANAKVISLQTQINENIVGGTDPCFIVFQTASDKKGYTVIVNEGKIPVVDVQMYLTDFSEMMKCKQSSREDYYVIDEPCYNKCTKVLGYPVIMPGPQHLEDYSLPDTGTGWLYEIRFIYSRNNTEYLEQLVCRRTGTKIECLARVFKARNNKYEVIKTINPENVDWNVDFDKLFNVPRTRRAFAPIYWR